MRKDKYYSKRQLEKNIRKMGEIIMIGAIASIEQRFGFLWGKDKQEYTEEENQLYEIWENLRKDILDKGNANIQKTIDMLGPFDVYMGNPNTYIEFKRKNNGNL